MKFSRIPAIIKRRLQQLLLIKEIRIPFSIFRYFIFRYLLKKIKKWHGDGVNHGNDVLEYNFKNIKRSIVKHERLQHIIRPLMAIEDVNHRLPELKTLSIGPRSESELLLIAGYGFTWSNIRGLDLFSYCPRIDVGDMHNMPYEDNAFDVVFLGWVLTYSENPERALKEIVRVIKPGGYIAFGNGYDSTLKNGEVQAEYYVGARYRENSLDDLLEPIKENIDTMFFRHDITQSMADKGQRAILGVFSVKK